MYKTESPAGGNGCTEYYWRWSWSCAPKWYFTPRLRRVRML